MADFVALYRSRTVSEAELVAVWVEPQLVRSFFAELLGEHAGESEASDKESWPAILELMRSEE